ncbi:MAG TPA: hypothetical protein DCZ91_06950 [Lachnospiraceae bacterium]|nr:hypothetical protein [Lachnospiraceae bacterium]
MGERESRKRFGASIRGLRRKKGFSQEQVSAGLCTAQELSYFEKGERTAPNLLQDALQERLGVGAEDYEHYLDYPEYEHWEARQGILHFITWDEPGRAAGLLEAYRAKYPGCSGDCSKVTERLERQFYLAMLALIRGREGAKREELYGILEEAIRLTVPTLWREPLGDMVLSIKELNLILEAEHCREDGGEEGHYREILAYIESSGLDGIGMAKIYPKAVWFLWNFLCGRGTRPMGRAQDQEGEASGSCVSGLRVSGLQASGLLVSCNRAIEILRNASRMYYLWELLGMRRMLLEQQMEVLLEQGEGRKADALQPMYRESGDWIWALESAYAEFGVPRETFEYCYLYVEKGVFCISDVVRIRRKMLGLSVAELSSGICTERTLRRLENRQSTSQRAIVEAFFERLGLSTEMTRTELVTESPEARQLMERLRDCINDYREEDAARLYAQVRELVPAELKTNQQVLLHKEANLRQIGRKLEGRECYETVRDILEITMPYESFLKEGEKYLTYEEQSCIQTMMMGMEKDGEEFLTSMERFEEMYRPFEEKKLVETVNIMYEYVMRNVGSEWGNMGEYDRSDKYNRIIAEVCLRTRRMNAIERALYGRCWNYGERRQKGILCSNLLDEKMELERCLLFSRMDKQKHSEQFYQKKLKEKWGG